MKSMRILFAMLALLALPMMSGASSYSFAPYDASGTTNDVFDLDHNYLYIWGINAPISLSNEIITSATISIKNINNWDSNWNILKFYILDNPNINDNASSIDIISIYDGSSTASTKEMPALIGQKFTDYAQLKTSYTDSNGVIPVDQFSYSFSPTELEYLTNFLKTANTFGKNTTFGLGFDPDCHFYNSGINLEITTSPVPEPGTFLLLGAGLLGLAGFRIKRRS